jgi:uncharacterized protein with GYD domain
MPTYVCLYTFTEQGRKNIKGTVQRAEAILKENESRGFTVHGYYWTQGRFDLVTVVEAPTEAAMMAGLFSIAEAGNAVSETMRAFTADEMRGIVGT